MKKTLVVPIDFTPVSHEALLYACELSVNNEMEIVAVHILDSNIINQFQNDEDQEVRNLAGQMHNEIIEKTKTDLDNFLEGLSVFYGDIIKPVIAFGTIYEAFNEVAANCKAPLIVMGTHGIVGMQHIFGSKAYKVILHSPFPFLIVQERSYNTIKNVYIALKHNKQLLDYAEEIKTFASLFAGNFIFNTYDLMESKNVAIPPELLDISDRFKFINSDFKTNNIVESAKIEQADVIGMIINEEDNNSDTNFGMTQDKILVNQYKLPVLCLPAKN